MRWGLTCLRAPLVAALCWLAAATPALATILDEPESLTEGSDAVVRVHFDVRVQYQRHAPTGTADLVEVFFQIVGTDLTLSPGVEEQVKTPENGRVPAVTITYPIQPEPGNVGRVKKIIVRFSRKVTFKVRAGARLFQFHSDNFERIDITAFTQEVTGEIMCGPRKTANPVVITYAAARAGSKIDGEANALEFVPGNFVLKK